MVPAVQKASVIGGHDHDVCSLRVPSIFGGIPLYIGELHILSHG